MDIYHQEIKFLDNMDLGLAFKTNIEFNKQNLFIRLSDELEVFFSSKQYGSSIEHFTIGVICVESEMQQFFKARKPRYKTSNNIKLLNGNIEERHNIFSYEIILNFNEILNASEEECKKILASEILKSLSYLDLLPKKVKDFDKERFKADMYQFFKEQNLV